MSVDTFIPEVWAARLLENMRKAQVFTQAGIVNRDYEGDIANVGDTVRIHAIGAVTIGSYVKNVDIAVPEQLTDAETTLLIDTGRYFNFAVDDVDKRQISTNLIDAAMREAAYGLRDVADKIVSGLYASAGSSVGTAAAPKVDMAVVTNAYVHLVELGVKLDDMSIPTDGRWVTVPPWYHGKLLQDDRFVKSGVDSAAGVLANGEVGQAAGFRILKSNNISNDATTWRIMAGTDAAISFAEQINKVEAFRPERRFADAVKGLHLYGVKVIRPAALTVLYANIA